MDLETENRIAAILLKEAAELRRQAEKEGVLSYFNKPTVRSRPNSRFLSATVLGVQQANRAVEVNEMWRLRQKELDLDNRLRGTREESSGRRSDRDVSCTSRSTSRECYDNEAHASASCLSKKRVTHESQRFGDDGLRDDEMEEFLHARIKRGRGAVGSRMDETGPYLPSSPNSKQKQAEFSEDEFTEKRLGPEKPLPLQSEDESFQDKKRKEKKLGSSKHHSRKHIFKEKSEDKKREKKHEKKIKRHK